MKLCVDIGNTRIKWAVFEGQELLYRDVFTEDMDGKLEQLKQRFSITSSISSSTRKGALPFQQKLAEHFKHIILSHETPLPIDNKYETPKTLGVDRLAGVIGARSIFPKKNCLVIDAGTCITYDFLQSTDAYLGGNIAPGVTMRLKAMHHFTDGLPLIDFELPAYWLGKSTETAMQNGAVSGTIMEIKGYVQAINDEFSKVNVILTGGDAVFFAKVLNTEIFVSSNLVLMGLNEILEYNA